MIHLGGMLEGGRPSDSRGFVHKRIFRGIKGLVTGGITGGISGFLLPPPRRQPQPVFTPAPTRIVRRAPARGIGERNPFDPITGALVDCFPPFQRDPTGRFCVPAFAGGGGGGQDCPPGTVPDPQGRDICLAPCSPIGKRAGLCPTGTEGGFGDAAMGQFGAGLQPATTTRSTRSCPTGAVLGKDGLCYNKTAIANRNRMYPRGRRPLLTGGEMRCISIASRAADKLQRKEKQLRKMGMLPSPTRRRSVPKGHHAHIEHN